MKVPTALTTLELFFTISFPLFPDEELMCLSQEEGPAVPCWRPWH